MCEFGHQVAQTCPFDFLLELAEVAKEKGKVVCCTRLSQPFLLYLVVEVPLRARFDGAGPVFFRDLSGQKLLDKSAD